MTSSATPFTPLKWPARTGSGYPEPLRFRVLPREMRAVGDASGLTRIGVNHTTLGPGAASSMRHRHGHEDEFGYALAGEPDAVDCPDVDLRWNASGAPGRYAHKSGRPY